MVKSICQNCKIEGKSALKVKSKKTGKTLSIEFCSYKCYCDFWKDVSNFTPLKEI